MIIIFGKNPENGGKPPKDNKAQDLINLKFDVFETKICVKENVW